MNDKRLMRTSDRMIAGVCGGIAEFFGLDATLVRIAMLALILCLGLSAWIYILLWIVMPGAPKRSNI